MSEHIVVEGDELVIEPGAFAPPMTIVSPLVMKKAIAGSGHPTINGHKVSLLQNATDLTFDVQYTYPPYMKQGDAQITVIAAETASWITGEDAVLLASAGSVQLRLTVSASSPAQNPQGDPHVMVPLLGTGSFETKNNFVLVM